MLNELDALKLIRHKYYAFLLGGSIGLLCIIFLLIEHAAGAQHKYFFTTLGTALLFYMLVNAISCLLVENMWAHVKRTIPVYVLNVLLSGGLIYWFIGGAVDDHKAFYPALAALIFCFFASMVLILVIRSVASFLKEE